MKNIRSLFFWFIDRLKGSPVKRHYDEVKFINECFDKAEARKQREASLQKLLDYAVHTIPFYQNYTGLNVLSDFPVIDKNIIRDNSEKFLSPDYKFTSLKKMTTSGSTGTPFTVYHDKNKVKRSIADFIYAYKMAHYAFGNRIYKLKGLHDHNRKNRLELIAKNIIENDTADLSKEGIVRFLKTIAKYRSKKMLMGYASSYTAIARNTEKDDIKNIGVDCIITGAESLPLAVKDKLKYLFECPVYSRYSNMENGFLAQQCDNHSEEFHLNVASYYFEILSFDNDLPVKSGEKGRIVVTDLFNYAMPLIRYDTGDVAVYDEKAKCSLKTPVFKTIEGRIRDFLIDTNGKLLSPGAISTAMWRYSEVLQYQFIQEGEKKFTIKLNCRDKFNRERPLIEDIKKQVGSDAIIDIVYVSEIPLLKSGKRKYIINNYKTS